MYGWPAQTTDACLQDTAENKLVYTQLFEAYCALLEGTIESALTQAVQGFSMAEFADMLADRRDQLGAEVRNTQADGVARLSKEVLMYAKLLCHKSQQASLLQDTASSADAGSNLSAVPLNLCSPDVGASCHGSSVVRAKGEKLPLL